MKRSIILLVSVALVAVLFTGLTENVNASKSNTCCQKFEIISAGSVLTGCVISIVYAGTPLQCKPDNTGKCEICGIPEGVEYTVEVNCDEGKHGSTTFKACTDGYVTIYVP